jgi:PAS domain S-box-containing protein
MNHQHFISANNDFYLNSSDGLSTTFQKLEKPDFLTTEQLYNAVFENAFHAMYIGSSQGRIIRFNEKLATLFGYSKWEMAQNHSSDLFDVYEKSFIDFLAQRKKAGIAKAEITAIKKTGETFPCRISSVIYSTEDGLRRSMNTIVNTSNNITARWNIAG